MIKYTDPHVVDDPFNVKEILELIGEVPPCPTCNDTGEYETNTGPTGCNPCNSRLIAFINHEGKRDYLDWGESIERKEDGLHKKQ